MEKTKNKHQIDKENIKLESTAEQLPQTVSISLTKKEDKS
jgi:hypothetical protein